MTDLNFSAIRHALLRALHLNETRFVERDGAWFAGSHRLVRVAQSAMRRFAEEGLITVEAGRATITPHGVDWMDAWAGRPLDLDFTEPATPALSPAALAVVPEVAEYLRRVGNTMRGKAARDGLHVAAVTLENSAGLNTFGGTQ